jgi:hypothetical protein
MSNLSKTEELIGLRFESSDAFQAGVSIYSRGRPDRYFASGGEHTAIIPKVDADWLLMQLTMAGYSKVQLIPVGSVSDYVSSETATKRRASGIRGDIADRENILAELQYRRSKRKR